MRKTVRFDRHVRIMIPVWHQPESSSTSRNQLKYKRSMIIMEIPSDVEYSCDVLQSLLDRGAIISDDDYTYVCSHGFVPFVSRASNAILSDISTGLDPKEELN